MEQNKTNNVLVAGTIKSIADGGIVVHTTDIYDPVLKMTQNEINTFDGEIEKQYGWKVLNRSEYDAIVPLQNVLYFLVDDDEIIDSETKLDGALLILNGVVYNGTVNITGTINNNTLTLA